MAVVDVKFVEEWSDAAPNQSEVTRGCWGVGIPSLMHLTRLSKLDEDSTFIMFRALPLGTCVGPGLDCSDSGILLPECRLLREST